MKLLVSACLLGVLCRYDGKAKTHEGVCSLLEKHTMIPFCPEIYGGLSTPRPASERLGERVGAKTGFPTKTCRKPLANAVAVHYNIGGIVILITMLFLQQSPYRKENVQ